jgi:hypothetical protein
MKSIKPLSTEMNWANPFRFWNIPVQATLAHIRVRQFKNYSLHQELMKTRAHEASSVGKEVLEWACLLP